MGIKGWLRGLLSTETSETETVTYQCQRCPAMFEEPAMKMTQVQCPECGSTRVSTVEED
ncbi:hypothetical protein [Halarchaeum sp. P4]|uniref:hypothetical protein n=1 Tax=Halarchaeum sp. P4 TaxID=3421639 RepID=UPI003EBE20D8